MRRKYLKYLSTYIVHPEPSPFCFTHLKYAGQLVNLYCECKNGFVGVIEYQQTVQTLFQMALPILTQDCDIQLILKLDYKRQKTSCVVNGWIIIIIPKCQITKNVDQLF